MKIWTLSDLHIDWSADQLPELDIPDHDVFVMPGDLANGDFDVVPWLMTLPENVRRRMIYVPGNHDFYNIGIQPGRDRLWDIADATGIIVLDNGRVEIDGQGFVGTTLWTSLAEDAWVEQACMDLVHIPGFSGNKYRRLHEEAVDFLDTATNPGDIVVSHHPPTAGGVAEGFLHNMHRMGLISTQCSDLGDLVERIEPLAWIHGHTHLKRSYVVNNVNVHTCATESLDFVFDTDGYTHRPPGYN